MDMLCQQLGMDPLEFRKRNASVTGSTMPIGTPFPAIGLTTILERVARARLLDAIRCPRAACPRGRGLALGYWRGTSMTSAAHITIAGDGRPMVTMGAVDLSGTRTTMAQVVAEEFGLPIEDIHIHTGDSKSVGYSDGAAGSRVARTMTAALVEASRDALAPAAPAARPRSCNARPSSSTMPSGTFRARNGRRRHLAGRADAGDADRRRHRRPRGFDQAAARRRDRRARVRRRGGHRHRPGDGAALHGLPGRGPCAQSGRGRGPDRGQRGAGAGLGADGGLRLRRRTGACATRACSTTACRPRSTCRRSTASSSRRRCRTCLTACAASARCRSCRRPPPSPTPSPARPACA